MIDERAFLKRLSSAMPGDLVDLTLHAGPEEKQVLRIHLGSESFEKVRRDPSFRLMR